MSDDSDQPEKVGYGRPPKHTRFKRGQSGNPKGRPKGSRNLSTEIEAELNAVAYITENGKRKAISKRALVAKQLVNKGASGDPKSIAILLNHDRGNQAEASNNPPAAALPAEDKLVMASIVGRIQKMTAVQAPFPAADKKQKK